MPWLSFILLFSMLSLSFKLSALPHDREQPLHIQADTSTFNYKTGTNVYEGHVEMKQGTTQLIADRVLTQNNKAHQLKEAVAYGINRLAQYSTIPKIGDPPFHAEAKTIKFYPLSAMIILEGNVFITQGDNSFKGNLIIYNMTTQVVTAPASQGERATMVINPKQLNL